MQVTKEDLELAQIWWHTVRESIPEDVHGLWFGITDLVHDGQSTRTLYVAGTSDFDANDETDDWATTTMWQPNERYVVVPGIARPEDDWHATLAYAVELVIELAPQTSAPPSLDGVAVGFDDGDVHVTWTRSGM